MTCFYSFGKDDLRLFRLQRVLVAVVWISGLILGIFLSRPISSDTFALIRTIRYSQTSFLRLFLFLVFPLILSVAVVWLRVPILILPLVFIKAVCFALCASVIILAFDDAGWLLSRLYIFSDTFAVIVLLWFWNRYINGWTFKLKTDFVLCFIVLFIICCIDSLFVSPFTSMLFNL